MDSLGIHGAGRRLGMRGAREGSMSAGHGT
jgi:hypothetical protein